MRNEDFDSLCKEIEEVFPTETRYTYYVPPVPKQYSRTNKPITSRGKLVDKYRNKIRDFKKLTGHTFLLRCDSPSTSTSHNSEFQGISYFIY